MGTFSLWHWLIVLAVALLLFGGRGKIKNIMGDIGQGVTAFKKGLKEPEKVEETGEEAANEPKLFYTIEGAGHNDTYVVGGREYFRALREFLEGLPR